MITQKEIDQIHDMKEFYRCDVVKETVVDKITTAISMCVDEQGNIYISCCKTNSIVVLDSELNELRSFKVDISPLSIAVMGKYLLLADARGAKMALYRCRGDYVWQKDAKDIYNLLQMPSIGAFNDEGIWLVDLALNTIYDLAVLDEGEIIVNGERHVLGERFYDSKLGQWSLRGIFRRENNLYTYFNNAIYMIDQQGVLREKIILPIPLINVMGIGIFKNFLYILDNKLNLILECNLDGENILKFKTINFDDGVVSRMLVNDDAVYLCKEINGSNIQILKISL